MSKDRGLDLNLALWFPPISTKSHCAHRASEQTPSTSPPQTTYVLFIGSGCLLLRKVKYSGGMGIYWSGPQIVVRLMLQNGQSHPSMAAMLIKRAAHWARSNLPPSGLNSIWRQEKLYEYAQVVCVDDIHEFIFHPAWSMKDIFHFIHHANPSEWYLGFLTKSLRYPRNGQQEKKTNL